MSFAALDAFHEPTREWFRTAVGAPTAAQVLGWRAIAGGGHALVSAPTGSGKTLAAFLTALDRLMFAPEPPAEERLRVLYLSPLKALGVDVERNLRAPLAGIAATAGRLGVPVRMPSVAVRTGDTPAAERARFRKDPADVLITTPESLYLLLTSAARDRLASVETIIVDELHAFAASKRGAHLLLSLERLEELRGGKPPAQRIGLSATIRPLEEAARLLGGGDVAAPDAPWIPRPVAIADAAAPKALDLRVETPLEDFAKLGEPLPEPKSGPVLAAEARRSVWPSIYPRLAELVRAHRSTLLFVNSRRLAERLAAGVAEAAGEPLVLAHHGSLARDLRRELEDRLKRGELRALAATSSLELGIDMGAVDLVVQIEAPPSVASALQRVGRAGHAAGATSRGVFFPKFRGDLLACAAAVEAMREGAVEPVRAVRNALDVLAQQIVAEAVAGPRAVDDLFRLVRRAAPYAELPRAAFDAVIDLLAGRTPSDDFAELRPRLIFDRDARIVRARPGAQRDAILGAGVIPDRGLYGVFLAGAPEGKPSRVGELDEEMVFETREGDVVVLGSASWRVVEITHDRVLVEPAPGEPGRMPFWKVERRGRDAEFGRRIGRLTRVLAEEPAPVAEARLRERHGLDAAAARNAVAYVVDQLAATGVVPSDRRIVAERFFDELGDRRVVVLSPFGGRVHQPWCGAVLRRLRERYGPSVDGLWTEDGLAFRLPESEEPAAAELFFPAPEEIEELALAALTDSPAFATAFREAAARALLLPRKRPGVRTPLWMQRKKALDLLAAAGRHPQFPATLEAVREVLQDVYDLPALKALLAETRSGAVRVSTVDTERASPFAASVLFAWTGAFLYDGDAPLAERRAQALAIDHGLLRDLLGEAELRRLLDPEAPGALERRLQGLAAPQPASAERLYDLLRRLGDLSREELSARVRPTAESAGAAETNALAGLDALVADRRVFALTVAGETRYVAAEDVARYRDALGCLPPPGTPTALLEPVADPLGDLLLRYARTHAPFAAAIVAARFGLGAAPVAEKLKTLAQAGRLLEGSFLPDGREIEWCDPDVLRALKRASTAKLRAAVEPVAAEIYARLLAERHGVATPSAGPEALGAALERLEGCPLPASDLFAAVLPARLRGFRSWDLDRMVAEGALVWAGSEASGPDDGRLALYSPEGFALLAPPPRPIPNESDLHRRVRAELGARGASFFADLSRRVGGFERDVLDALWDLVWAGEATNDTLAPLRARLFRGEARRGPDLRRASAFRTRQAGPPGSEGRWSLLERGETSPTRRAVAAAEALLARYGVVTRDAVRAEGAAGGFAAVYPVFREAEERGRVRRGYFIAGLGAAQFAAPGADDRLRALRDAAEIELPGRPAPPSVLAACDPAQPYGAAVPFPGEEPRPARAAGARVVLVHGRPVAYLARGERQVRTFPAADPAVRAADLRAAAEGLASLVDGARRRALLIAKIDGGEAAESPLAEALLARGFTATSKGLLLRTGARRSG
jgi:ATP-dependent Lhr-like helicase